MALVNEINGGFGPHILYGANVVPSEGGSPLVQYEHLAGASYGLGEVDDRGVKHLLNEVYVIDLHKNGAEVTGTNRSSRVLRPEERTSVSIGGRKVDITATDSEGVVFNGVPIGKQKSHIA